MGAVASWKRYRCTRCGQEKMQHTNHYGPTWSVGASNVCPNCPPWAKYAIYGGQTVWECVDVPPTVDTTGNTAPK